MSWFSILPAHLTVIETWIIRFFLLLGILTIGPWMLVLFYDLILYIVRAVVYEIPLIGGRARGNRRPRAPSLSERPNGRARTFSIGGPLGGSENEEYAFLRQRPEHSSGKEDAGAADEYE